MTTNPNDYDWMRREVTTLAEERGVATSRAFAAWCLNLVHDLEVDDALEQTATLEGPGGGDGGIDGWYRDEDNLAFHLWQCKWTDSPAKAFDRTVGDELLTALEALRDKGVARACGPKFAKLSQHLEDALAHGYAISLNVAVPTTFPTKPKDILDKKLTTVAKANGFSASFSYWDAEALSAQDNERIASTKSLVGERIQFRLQTPAVMKLEDGSDAIPHGWKAVVVSLQGLSLAEVARTHESNLFHLNVRYALGHKQKRIESIHRTLQSPETAKFFWFYNNGITILADDYDVKKGSIDIENPQVVNGCQTVTAFARTYPRFGESASVLARIICPPKQEEGKVQAGLISERTNSQVPVLARDLKSNDPVHVKLARTLGRFEPPWFYEVKRGEWQTLSIEERARYEDRRVDVEQLGQSLRMLTRPADALTHKKDLFENEETYNGVFSPERVPEEYLFAEIVRRYYAGFWSASQFDEIRRVCGEQFDDRLLRRLMSAKGQVVSHSVALTRNLFASTPELWTSDDARRAYALVSRAGVDLAPWTKHIANAIWIQVKLADAEAKADDREAASLKKHFERASQQTLRDLWESISGNATLWAGAAWRQQLTTALAG